MNKQEVNSSEDDFFGFALAIIFIIIGGVLFFGWEQFGNEMWLKLISMFFVLFGFAGFGMEVTTRAGEAAATDVGIGLGIILSALILGDIDFNFSLNLVVLLIVSFGAIPVLTSIFKLFGKNRDVKNPDLSFLYKTLIIIGQTSGALLAIIEFIQFFMR